MTKSVNEIWQQLLQLIISNGHPATPDNPAGATLEILSMASAVPMIAPVVTLPSRGLGYRFLAAEAAWILSGDNRLSSIQPFAKRIADTCDDGLTFRGAYGPKFVDQVGWVAADLARDLSSRRAVMTLWRERPGPTRDTPCTTSLQWLVRHGQLNCVVTMRSSDIWLGWPNDIHAFTMMSWYLLLTLRQLLPRSASLQLGTLYLTAGSGHLYLRNLAGVQACLNDDVATARGVAPIVSTECDNPDELVAHLWRVARRESSDRAWLTDVVAGKVN